MNPDSIVSMQTCSRVSEKLDRGLLSSSLALCWSPRDQANMEAMGLVEVSLPAWTKSN